MWIIAAIAIVCACAVCGYCWIRAEIEMRPVRATTHLLRVSQAETAARWKEQQLAESHGKHAMD